MTRGEDSIEESGGARSGGTARGRLVRSFWKNQKISTCAKKPVPAAS